MQYFSRINQMSGETTLVKHAMNSHAGMPAAANSRYKNMIGSPDKINCFIQFFLAGSQRILKTFFSSLTRERMVDSSTEQIEATALWLIFLPKSKHVM